MLLPASLLVLIALTPVPISAYKLPWINRAPFLRRSLGRDSDQNTKLNNPAALPSIQQPIGVRKMSGDEGEMFFPEYWTLGTNGANDGDDPKSPTLDKRKPLLPRPILEVSFPPSSNATLLAPLQAPFSLHTDESNAPLLRRLFPFQKRDYNCPPNTNACLSISRPNSCCPSDESCQLIADTGNGDVGCCSQGQTCGQEVGACQAGYASCPGAQGGGCCVPGYSCSGVGCIANSTDTVTVNPTATQPPTTSSSSPLAPIIGSTQTFTVGTTILYTVTGAPLPTTTPHTSTPSAPSSPPHPTSPPQPSSSSSSTIPAIIPLRPTSGKATTTHTTSNPPPTSSIIPTQCPTGFYDCAAFDHPGCCRVGRDCALSSCPAASTSQVLASNGVTVGVAQVSDDGLGQGGCALGWFSCASQSGVVGEEANGCCPSGYACGTSCTASGVLLQSGQTGTAKVAKNNPAVRFEVEWVLLGVAAGVGAGFVFA